jgi:RHS repeat-associated protein
MMKNVSLYLDGEIVQHVEYVPFGEVFIEERNNVWNTPYLFNAKELDEETGLYYYGARYYDARISLWLSADPLQEKYPNVSTYVYCVQNPVRFVDPDGMDEYEFEKNKEGQYVYNGVKNTKDGANYAILKDTEEKIYFADSENDAKSIESGDITQLRFVSDREVMNDLERAGVNKWYNKARNLWYLYKHSDASTGSGELDFVVNSEIFGYNTIMDEKVAVGLPDYYLYVKKDLAGNYIGHNNYNFGNYLWGAAANALEVSLTVTRMGAHANNYLNDPNHKGKLDSADDQLSISLGWKWRDAMPDKPIYKLEKTDFNRFLKR